MLIDMEFQRIDAELKQIGKQLRGLDRNVQDYLYGEMCIAAAKAFAKVAKASNAFNDVSGKLRKSIKAVRQNVVHGGRVIKGGGAAAKIGGKGARHANIIEGGTVDRYKKSTGQFTGRVKPGKMLETSFDTAQIAAIAAAFAAGESNFNKLLKAAQGKGKLSRTAQRRIAGL